MAEPVFATRWPQDIYTYFYLAVCKSNINGLPFTSRNF